LILVFQVNFHCFLLSKAELEILINNLDTIWHVVSAHILSLEQVNTLLVLAHEEGPLSVDLRAQAMYGLVRTDRSEEKGDGSGS